jgi:crossover junction endodeoxyribonuclease RuvC
MKRNLPRSTSSPRRPAASPCTRVVLGLDPGSRITGFGVVSQANGHATLIAAGVIRIDPDRPLPFRLRTIHDQICDVITEHQPTEFAIETAFAGKNIRSALTLGQARGVSLLAAEEHGLAIAEYSPREIKKSVVGNGNASKEQVRFMVAALLKTDATGLRLDASDAVAAALCHLHRATPGTNRHRSWRSFVDAHPGRVKS